MKNSSSLAKLAPPKLPKIVERVRLYKELNRAKDRQITWITAPPGMGKTTLAASYIKAKNLKCLWYQVDEGDADPATLFHYLGLACKRIAPRFKQPLPHLTPEYLPGLPVFTRRFFEKLFARLKKPTVLVLDNYQLLPIEGPIQEILSLGLNEIPDGLRVLILSRMDPSPAFARLLAEQKIHSFKEYDLRLTTQETGEIIRLKQPLSPKSSKFKELTGALQQYTRGWAAGVVLSIEHGLGEKWDPSEELLQTPEVVFDYLAREVFTGLSKDVQELLIKTALSPVITEQLAMGLTENSRAGRILDGLYRRRHFTERRQEPQLVYQYHPLFQDFLQAQARAILPTEEIQHIQAKIGIYLMDHGQEEKAVALLQEGRCFEELVSVIHVKAPSLIAEGRYQTLNGWLVGIPPSLFQGNPWLWYWAGAANRTSNFPKSQEHFEEAFQAWKSQGDKEGALHAWIKYMEGVFLQHSRTDVFHQWMERLSELLGNPATFPSRTIEAQVKCCMVGALWFYMPGSWRLRTLINDVMDLLPLIPSLFEQVQLSAHTMVAALHLGEIAKAEDMLIHLRKRIDTNQVSPSTKIGYLFAESLLKIHRGYVKQSICIAEEGAYYAEQECIEPLKILINIQIVTARLINQDCEIAEPLLRELISQRDKLPGHHKILMAYQEGWLSLLQQDHKKAWEKLHQALSFGSAFEADYPLSWVRILLITVADRLDDSQGVAEQLSEARRLVNATDLPFMKFTLGLTEAFSKRKDPLACQTVLRDTLKLAAKHDFFAVIGLIKPDLAWLCGKALEWDIEVDYVKEMIRRLELQPHDSLRGNPKWPWPIKIFTFGSFQFEIDGQSPESSRKLQQRPLAFLKAIITQGGQAVSEAALSDLLWPEVDGDKAHQAFASTLHRVRKLLKYESAIRLRGGKVSLDPQVCWVDACAFDQLLVQGQASEGKKKSEESLKHIEQALRLYTGPFLLAESDTPWAARMRERLQKKYLANLETLCTAWSRDGRQADARAFLERAMEYEPEAEKIYQSVFGE